MQRLCPGFNMAGGIIEINNRRNYSWATLRGGGAAEWIGPRGLSTFTVCSTGHYWFLVSLYGNIQSPVASSHCFTKIPTFAVGYIASNGRIVFRAE